MYPHAKVFCKIAILLLQNIMNFKKFDFIVKYNNKFIFKLYSKELCAA